MSQDNVNPGLRGFAATASELLASARMSEAAVRDLDETARILADDIALIGGTQGLARTLDELGERVGDLADPEGELMALIEGLGERMTAASDLADRLEKATMEASAVEEDVTRGLSGVTSRLEACMGSVERMQAGVDSVNARLEALEAELARRTASLEVLDSLEARVNRLIEVFDEGAVAYTGQLEPQLERLEQVAERMDMPSMADQLADVLATNRAVLELSQSTGVAKAPKRRS